MIRSDVAPVRFKILRSHLIDDRSCGKALEHEVVRPRHRRFGGDRKPMATLKMARAKPISKLISVSLICGSQWMSCTSKVITCRCAMETM